MRRSTIEMSCPTARAAKPNCPTSFAVKPVRSSASFTRVPYSPRLFAASNADTAMVPRTAAPVATAIPKGPRAVSTDETAPFAPWSGFSMNWLTRSPNDCDGFGLLPQRFFGFLGRLDRESFARGLLLHGDHLFVGSGDRVDGLRLAVVSLEKLVPLGDQPVHAALAVGLGLLFEGGDEPLDAGPRLIRNPDDLAVRRFRFLLEAVEAGVGLVHYRGDLVLGFEDYAFCLVCHFTLP